MPGSLCVHPDCAARLPRSVDFCPYCGTRQRIAAVSPLPPPTPVPKPRPGPTPAPVPAPKPAVAAPEKKGGIGFWLVALALMFSFWLSFSDDKKPPPEGKMRQNAGQQQRK